MDMENEIVKNRNSLLFKAIFIGILCVFCYLTYQLGIIFKDALIKYFSENGFQNKTDFLHNSFELIFTYFAVGFTILLLIYWVLKFINLLCLKKESFQNSNVYNVWISGLFVILATLFAIVLSKIPYVSWGFAFEIGLGIFVSMWFCFVFDFFFKKFAKKSLELNISPLINLINKICLIILSIILLLAFLIVFISSFFYYGIVVTLVIAVPFISIFAYLFLITYEIVFIIFAKKEIIS